MNCHECSDNIESVVTHEGNDYCSTECAGICPSCHHDDISSRRLESSANCGGTDCNAPEREYTALTQPEIKMNYGTAKTRESQRGSETIGAIIRLAIIVICVASWFTHIIHCLSEEAWGFLIAGAIMFPIAIIHGIGLWFGFF